MPILKRAHCAAIVCTLEHYEVTFFIDDRDRCTHGVVRRRVLTLHRPFPSCPPTALTAVSLQICSYAIITTATCSRIGSHFAR